MFSKPRIEANLQHFF